MTNEELSVSVQAGNRENLLTLWRQVRRFAIKEVNKRSQFKSGGAEVEDLEQAAFIALMRASDSFDQSKGFQFTTWYYKYLLAEFGAVMGRRTKRQINEPMNGAASLDAPVAECDKISLGEAVPDECAEAAMQEVDRCVDAPKLHDLLWEAVNALPPCQRAAVSARYFDGPPVKYQSQHLQNALRKLRKPETMQKLQDFY